jgi:protein SCO1/2
MPATPAPVHQACRGRWARVTPPLLAIALCGLVVLLWACAPARPLPAQTAPALNGASLEPVVDLPPLTFTRSDGGMFSSADTRGRTSLFFFGYTHCADVCPLTLAELAQVHRQLDGRGRPVDLYFITLDPARDTPERLRDYMANFPGVVGLTGSDTDLARAQASFHVLAERRDMGDGDYMLDHTAATYLVNPASQIQLAYPYGTPPDDIVADLQRLVAPTLAPAT